jgi:hypothetical protein
LRLIFFILQNAPALDDDDEDEDEDGHDVDVTNDGKVGVLGSI